MNYGNWEGLGYIPTKNTMQLLTGTHKFNCQNCIIFKASTNIKWPCMLATNFERAPSSFSLPITPSFRTQSDTPYTHPLQFTSLPIYIYTYHGSPKSTYSLTLRQIFDQSTNPLTVLLLSLLHHTLLSLSLSLPHHQNLLNYQNTPPSPPQEYC